MTQIFFLLVFLSTTCSAAAKPFLHSQNGNNLSLTETAGFSTSFSSQPQTLHPEKKATSGTVLIKGNSNILSENGTFALGFFSPNKSSNWYLGIWFAKLPFPTYVWVANREKPTKDLSSSTLEITETGQLVVKDSGETILWHSANTKESTNVKLLDNGNLVAFSEDGAVTWQSFDFPSDTWLPEMNLTRDRSIISWRSSSDPSPGLYSLRLRPPQYGEFELVYNNTRSYWSTGNWTGNSFVGVPEMTIRYIYNFHFAYPFTQNASFWFSETSLDSSPPPLSRFQLDYSGQLKQYTWTQQIQTWNMFWSQPESSCRVYGLCGNMGFCNTRLSRPCMCVKGFVPADEYNWEAGAFSSGCKRSSRDLCRENDRFENAGVVGFEGAEMVPYSTGNKIGCQKLCLQNCSCIGLYYNESTASCKNLYGSILNLRNLSSARIYHDVLYVRIPKRAGDKKGLNSVILIASIACVVAVSGLTAGVLFILHGRRLTRKEVDDDGALPVQNLRMFSFKELHAVTRGFSEKIGHGGFGTVFRGELPDSSLVAVKRLERPGGGEKEFKAEVCTIGNIQHVNLVRLRGFCSENLHRLLVYDYLPNGPLSAYLRGDGLKLSWDVRYRVAIGTAKGLAYLHEECRDCIIHCDIKPENILLDCDFTAKVSDFGLAKLLGRDFSRVLATMRGTWGYVAPEWISGVAITSKADVYSYGMTLLELIGGRRNVEAPSSDDSANGSRDGGKGEKWFFPPWAARKLIEGNVAAVVDPRLGNQYNREEAERLGLVAVWCIQDDEMMRPTMSMVVKMLEGVVRAGVPPAPKLLQSLVSEESFCGIKDDSEDEISGGFPGNRMTASGANSQAFPSNVTSPAN